MTKNSKPSKNPLPRKTMTRPPARADSWTASPGCARPANSSYLRPRLRRWGFRGGFTFDLWHNGPSRNSRGESRHARAWRIGAGVMGALLVLGLSLLGLMEAGHGENAAVPISSPSSPDTGYNSGCITAGDRRRPGRGFFGHRFTKCICPRPARPRRATRRCRGHYSTPTTHDPSRDPWRSSSRNPSGPLRSWPRDPNAPKYPERL